MGSNHFGTFGNFSTIIEAVHQFGKMRNIDMSAYLLSLQANVAMTNWKFIAGGDILSGTDVMFLNYQENYLTELISID